jgi:carbonic anhydrase
MQMLVNGMKNIQCCPHLASWLQVGLESLSRVRSGFILDPRLSEHNQVSQVNVLQQMEHVASYPFVRKRVERKELQIHGWWFDIAHADVYAYEKSLHQFVLIE